MTAGGSGRGGSPTAAAVAVPAPVGRALDGSRASSVVASSHTLRDYWMRRGLALSDLAALATAMSMAWFLAGRADIARAMAVGLLSVPVWLLVFRAYGLYDRETKRVSHGPLDDVPSLFHAVLVGSLLLWGLFKVSPAGQLVLQEVVVFAGALFIFVLALRSATRKLLDRALGRERVLLVGDGRSSELLIRKLIAHPEYNLYPIGVVTGVRESRAAEEIVGVPVLGALDELPFDDVIARHRIERVILSHTDLPEPSMLDILWRCKALSIKVGVIPRLFSAMGPSTEVDEVEGITVLGINPPVLTRSSRALKRALDLTLASGALVIAAPLLPAIAFAIKLDSNGPILFRQIRTGRRGARFHLLKFRTMVADADARRAEMLELSIDPNWLHVRDDPRITRVGRFLRVTSLDELPQLWNVLKGEMSIVGPRPLIEDEDARVDGWGRIRLDLTPGITGLWQVLGRTSIPFDEMVKLDHQYVTNWSLWSDVRLVLRTFPAVLRRRGAN